MKEKQGWGGNEKENQQINKNESTRKGGRKT